MKKTKNSIKTASKQLFFFYAPAIIICFMLAIPAYSLEAQGAEPPVPNVPKTGGKKTAEKEKDIIADALATARKYCVGVKIVFTPPPTDDTELRKLHRIYSRMLEVHRSKEIPMMEDGVIIAPDRVLIDVPMLRPEDVESITVITADGKSYSAEPGGFLQNFNSFYLKVKTSSGMLPTPVFDGKSPEKPGDGYTSAYIYYHEGCWMLTAKPRTITGSNVSGKGKVFASDGIKAPSLLLDGDGKPFGVATQRSLWINENGSTSFDGKAIQNDKSHAMGSVVELWERIEENIAPCTLPLVTFVFRPVEEDERSTWYARRSATLEEVRLYGVFTDDEGTIFIPGSFAIEKVKRIDRINVECGGTTRQATFLGSFRQFDGILIRVQDYSAVTPPSTRMDGDAACGELLYAASVSYSFGGRFMQFIPNRIKGLRFGVGGKLIPYTEISLSSGSFLMDSGGNVIGFMSQEYPETADGTKSATAATQRMGYSRLFLFRELKKEFESPERYFDPKARVLTREEEKKLAWLGIEYQAMDYQLAKYLKILSETKNGSMGFMIIHIYPGSPADRLHLRDGDILLSLRPVDEKTSIELTELGSGRYYGRRRYFPGFGKPRPPWRDRKNTLTDTMTWIGKDRRTELTFLRRSGREDYAAKTVTLTIEEAPADFSSAEEYKDDTLGFTVKGLTYEVRLYQKLPEEERGVVISDIETGMAAEIAKLGSFEIIREVDGVAVQGIGHFKSLIDQALNSDSRKTIRFLVVNFGQTRFADLEKK
ncbi:MAG: hypothetical protein ACYS8W_12270 [Planctomycetota bacterium]|jgi:S1-C subfamily serine protease